LISREVSHERRKKGSDWRRKLYRRLGLSWERVVQGDEEDENKGMEENEEGERIGDKALL